MADINHLKQRANDLRSQKRYFESLEVYEELWDKFNDCCGCWDGWGYAYCLRKDGRIADALNVCRNIYRMDKTFKPGKELYAWCIYDLEIKKENEQIQLKEKRFFRAASVVLRLVQQTKYSPYVKTVFRVVNYLYSKNNVDYTTVVSWLNKVSLKNLSAEIQLINNSDGEQVELVSEKDNYYSQFTKALYKLKKYEECLLHCEEALSVVPKFKYGNDIWINWRLALCKNQLGYKDEGVKLLEDVLQRKKEWFVQYELSVQHKELQNFDKALEFGIEAALNKGRIENKWKLIWHIGKLFLRNNEKKIALKHFILADMLVQEQGWSQNSELLNDIAGLDCGVDQNKAKLIKELQAFWQNKKYDGNELKSGVVAKMLPHGKAGFIKTNKDKSYYFHVRNLQGRKKSIKIGLPVSFYLADSYDKKRQKKTFEAVNITFIEND